MSLSAVLLMVMLVVVLDPENGAAAQPPPPRPYITKQPATVLFLQCRVPWEAVKDAYRLDIGFCDSASDQCAYAYYVLSPGHQRLSSTGLKSHPMAVANVTEQNGPVLSVRMPITEDDDVDQYFCLVHYTTGNTRISYSVNVKDILLDDPHGKWNGSLFVRISRAHNVIVTWGIPKTSEPIDMKIDRVHLGLGKDGKVITYTKLIVSANNDRVSYDDSSTFLAKVLSTPDEQNSNYTVSSYVPREFCFPNCSYQCRSIITCTESNNEVCFCEGIGMSEPHHQCNYRDYIIAMKVGFPSVILIFIVFILVCQLERCKRVRKDMKTCFGKRKVRQGEVTDKPPADPALDTCSGNTPPKPHDRNPLTNQPDHNPATVQRDRNPPTIQRDRNPPTIQRDRNPPTVQRDRNPTTIQRDRNPRTIQRDRNPPTIQRNHDPPPRDDRENISRDMLDEINACTDNISQTDTDLNEMRIMLSEEESQLQDDFNRVSNYPIICEQGDGATGETEPRRNGVDTPLLSRQNHKETNV